MGVLGNSGSLMGLFQRFLGAYAEYVLLARITINKPMKSKYNYLK